MDDKITPEDLIDFMISKKYINFKKTKNNKPDMRCSFNKQYYNLLRKLKTCEKNKKENIHSFTTEKEKDYRKEIIDMTDEEIELFKNINESCVICGEIMKNNHSVLKCKHVFCNDCMISHFRVKDNCPLCRTTICKKPKKIDQMSEELCKGIIDYEIQNINGYNINSEDIQGSIENTTFSTTFSSLLTYYEMICNDSNDYENAIIKENIKQVMFKIITHMTMNISNKICGFYDEQL